MLALGAFAGHAQSISDAQRGEIEKIIREYLLKHPEVLQEAIAELEKKQAAAEAEKHQAAVKDNAEALFNSPRQVVVGNPQGDVTFVEFFDYNCGYCKRAMTDMLELMKDDPKLKVVLKEFPVLGPGSVEAARVAVAVRMQDKTGKKYLEFHQKLLGGRGQADKARALAVAKEVGLDMARLERDMASDEVAREPRGELQARREARAQRHAELRDRQRRRGRRGRPRGAEGKGQHRPLRQGDLLAPLYSASRSLTDRGAHFTETVQATLAPRDRMQCRSVERRREMPCTTTCAARSAHCRRRVRNAVGGAVARRKPGRSGRSNSSCTLGPGSGADIGARLIAEKLSARWGQPVVVENRPGGDGFVAITAFVSARDDHTLLFGPASSFTAHPYLHDKLPYDPRDLAPVARVSATLITIAVPPTLDVNSLQELVAMARAQPGKLNWATVTGATDLVLAAFLKSAGLDMAKIPYRDTVQALNDVAEGRLHLYWAALCHRARRGRRPGASRSLAITASEPTSIAARHADRGAGRLPAADLRRPGRHLRHARHAGRVARAHRRRRQGGARRSGDRRAA